MPPHRSRGVSLVELMVALLIIGVIASVSIPNALQARIRGNDSTAKTILGTLAATQEEHRKSVGRYWPLTQGEANAELYDPTESPDFALFAGLKAPAEYRAYATTLEDPNGITHYCVAVMHHRHQSNAWIWTSKHIADHTKIPREELSDRTLAAFEARMATECNYEITN